jgi:predicted CXXCH cytochrome family protein
MRASVSKRTAAQGAALLLLLLAMVGLAGLLHAVAGGGAHLEQSDCASCHMAGKNVTPQLATMLLSSQETLCARCHPAALQVSHPSGIQPRTAPPPGYPLDWKGDLTCSTCHEIHGKGHGLIRGALAGRQLCLACHAAEFFKAMRDGGASLTSGHLAPASTTAGALAALDPYSRRCMECHGANATPRLSTSVDRNGVMRHASQSINHPIGMNYQKAAAFGGYRPRAQVERRLLLPDGKMSCVSCHGGFQKEHGKLNVVMTQSNLCFECHNL